MDTRISKSLGPVAVAVLLLIAGCAVPGELRTESRSVEPGAAESVGVEIKMGAGLLEVGGGAEELLDAEFAYNVASLRPEVDYQVSGTRGLLTVRQPASPGVVMTNLTYEWDLRLRDHVPMDLTVEFGFGDADLKLGALSLSTLDIRSGAGNVTVDLSDSRSLRSLDLVMAAGGVTLDLTGDWQDDLDANIARGVGNATVRLPNDVGVRVEAPRGLGTINASGLERDGDAYVNDAYGESDVTLQVRITGGIGDVTLELGD